MNTISKSAQRVQDIIHSKGLVSQVKELSQSTHTALEAANTIGCEIGQIVKSLLFCTHAKKTILLLVSGANKVNEQKMELLIGEKITKATPEFVREVTGFVIGGVPPFGHEKAVDYIFIDEDLRQYQILWAAAGTPTAVFSLKPNDLQSLTNGKIISVK